MKRRSSSLAMRMRRAFTLVELMVSLVAGLIIAMAVVGLAKTTTNTFHDEARLSVTEGSVRLGAERLRQDLSRAAFMSTGNIKLARDCSPASVDCNAAVPTGHKIANFADSTMGPLGSRYNALNDLAGLRIIVGGSGTSPITGAGSQGPLNLATQNGLNPDAIILGGNYSTDDQYTGTVQTGGLCGTQQVVLKPAGDAASRRLLTQADPDAALKAAFLPQAGRKFAARIVDSRNCQHYVVVCGVRIVNGTDGEIGFDAPNLPGGPGENLPMLPASNNCGNLGAEQVTVNPINRVRWYIGPNVDPLTGADDAGIENVGNKFNVYRDLLDAADPPVPVAQSRQIIAEWAVDLKFGITVNDAPNAPALKVFDMDSDPGGGNIDTWTRIPTSTQVNQPGPQRVRSVRFRLATRSALPDRRANMTIPGVPAPYMVRYCTDPPTCQRYARVRTVVSEAALVNQGAMTY